MKQVTWNQFKIAFWDFIIYFLSESKWARSLIRNIFRIFLKTKRQRDFTIAGMVGLAGFLSGVFFFLLTFGHGYLH